MVTSSTVDLALVAPKCHANILREAFWNVGQRAKISVTKSKIFIKKVCTIFTGDVVVIHLNG